MYHDMRGFTLLELLIVLVIISILSLVVAPRISVFMSGKRSNTLLMSAMIEKTFDEGELTVLTAEDAESGMVQIRRNPVESFQRSRQRAGHGSDGVGVMPHVGAGDNGL